jgi:hypothetical protein
MLCRFRVGLHGKTFTDYPAAWREARNRGRKVRLVIGSRALGELPEAFTLQQTIGSIVYVNHTPGRGQWLAGTGRLEDGQLHIRVDHAKGDVVYTRPATKGSPE